ncbi:Protein of unknown function [Pyronema omphalodes CBS 100304]|uniref:Uncharacterized protein n=1 Tax=Pyronema omphalodes (strain CBS 100304) TaxID=1076935 RepID=U4LT47_PYROM|nr:Protein of unknown function [Pyronema omphalodes CBS 100304]
MESKQSMADSNRSRTYNITRFDSGVRESNCLEVLLRGAISRRAENY